VPWSTNVVETTVSPLEVVIVEEEEEEEEEEEDGLGVVVVVVVVVPGKIKLPRTPPTAKPAERHICKIIRIITFKIQGHLL